ncbi:MAG: shikimate kinase [Lachnospiraceae bacterium]|nr:shikimate kinase [Lachnospiraceae bacterium]
MNKSDNVILIGMPGAGKSTIGVVLAKKMGFHFVDSDLVIQRCEGRLLHEIIQQEGVDGFLAIENKVNGSMWEKHAVIATGGSAVYGTEAMEHFQEIGTVVYLKLPFEEIEERLGDLNERGVVLKPEQTLKMLYDERIELYEKYADQIVDCTGKSIREIVVEISQIIV